MDLSKVRCGDFVDVRLEVFHPGTAQRCYVKLRGQRFAVDASQVINIPERPIKVGDCVLYKYDMCDIKREFVVLCVDEGVAFCKLATPDFNGKQYHAHWHVEDLERLHV